MHRERTFLAAYLVCIVVGLSLAKSAAATDPPRPNIVFIMADDLGKEWVGCYGGDTDATPRIDALAATGMKFLNAYSMPQCTPTRVTLLTGQYPFRHGWVNHWDVPRWGRGCHFDPARNPCVARVLQSAGYRTCIAGKWQINDFRLQPDVLNQLGFDEFCMWTGYEADNPPSAERYWNPYLHTRDGSRTWTGEFGPKVCNDFLLEFLDRQSPDRPFFIYYPMILPHPPLTSTPHRPDATGDKRHAAMVEYIDFLTGRLVQKLEERGLRKNTIVIWTTDNGTAGGIVNRINGRSVRGAKGKTLENGVCQPFLVNCPGLVPEGIVTAALTDFTDLLPTFAELAGAALPSDHVIDGRSLASLILGTTENGPREWIMAMGGQPGTYDEQGRVINQFRYRDRVIRDQRYKLFVETDRSSIKLVDLVVDPDELVNRLDDPELAEIRARLEAVAATFPDEDADPRYSPLPPQPWDVVQERPGRRPGSAGLPDTIRGGSPRN